uniref:Uncharacterized protein n=1 Tax=Oryza nivara TaxID=4536 RepID=A0A0E0IJG1_ORYNI
MRRRCLAPRSTFGKSFPKSNPSLRFAARFDRLCRRWRRRRGRAFSSRELAAALDGIVNVNSLFTITAFIGLAWRPSGLRRWSRARLAEGADRQCAAAVSCTAMINRVALRVGSLAMAVGSVCLGAGS